MKNKIEIKEFWDNQAKIHGSDSKATMPDNYLKKLEIKNIKKYLVPNTKVIDIGCGNGFSTFEYAKELDIDITGVDYSQDMLNAANAIKQKGCLYHEKIEFKQGNVLALKFDSSSFDTVITDRCLINLTSRDEQKSAIDEIFRILKPGGRYLMCEDTEQGLEKLNYARNLLALDEIKVRWHNLYMDEMHIAESIKNLFVIEKIDLFASFYYLVSRTITGKLAQNNGVDPDYSDPINCIASECSSAMNIGDFTPLKLFVLKKI